MEDGDGEGGPRLESGEVTRLIHRWRGGDASAQDALFASVYDDLRSLAASYMRRERAGHTLPPTGLVNEAFLRMDREQSAFQVAENRRHFFTIAARAMRRILVEHARFHAAARRPSSRDGQALDDFEFEADEASSPLEILTVDQAMDRLRDANERQAHVVELRYFAGLEEAEIAELLGVSRATVSRDWRVARLLLRSFISDDAGP